MKLDFCATAFGHAEESANEEILQASGRFRHTLNILRFRPVLKAFAVTFARFRLLFR
jgi:hypothetical protein